MHSTFGIDPKTGRLKKIDRLLNPSKLDTPRNSSYETSDKNNGYCYKQRNIKNNNQINIYSMIPVILSNINRCTQKHLCTCIL